MRLVTLLLAAVIATAPSLRGAQDDALGERVMARVRAAVAPVVALFPDTDATGSVPADGKPTSLWMVRPHQAGDRSIDILANPLNEDYQRRAAKAMAQIESSIEAAQRRAELQYERAIAEAKRTRTSQDVVGVSLADEGVAGARIDAESRLVIEVLFNQPSYRFEIGSSVDPAAAGPQSWTRLQTAVNLEQAVISVASNVYRDPKSGEERFCEGQTLIYLGRTSTPSIEEAARLYTVTATGSLPSNPNAISSIVIRVRGNEVLMSDLLRRSRWSSVLELIE